SVVTSTSIILIIIGSMMFGEFLAITGLNVAFTNLIIDIDMSAFTFFVSLIIIFAVLGMFLEATSILALMVPILVPIINTMGWDPIWFGVFMVLMMEIAAVTPPVGLNLYTVKASVSEVK